MYTDVFEDIEENAWSLWNFLPNAKVAIMERSNLLKTHLSSMGLCHQWSGAVEAWKVNIIHWESFILREFFIIFFLVCTVVLMYQWLDTVFIFLLWNQFLQNICGLSTIFLSHMFSFGFITVIQEDPVLLTPEEKGQKPYVAIIKVIFLLIYLSIKS